MFLGIADIFVNLFSKMMYGLSQAFLWILYWIEKVFKILAGVEPIPGSNQSTSSILDQIFGIYESSNGTNLNQNGGIQIENSTTIKLFGFFLLIGLCVFIICLLAGVVRAWIKKDTPGEMKKCLSSSFKAVFYFVFIPTFFVISVFLLSRVFYIVTNYLSVTITGNDLEYGTTESTSIANTLWQRMFSAQDRTALTKNTLNFTNTYDEIQNVGVSLKTGETSYKYVIVIIVTAIMFWTMGIATIGLAERLINIVFLYLVSPIMIGASPLDSGERLNLWKDKVIVKFFGVMGNILSMYIFLLILGIVGNIVDNYHGDDAGYWILTAVFAIVCIAGAMMCCKGQTLLAGLISHAQANEEGLSSMATSQLAGKGLSIAGAGIGAAATGAFMGTKALANKGLGISNPSISQVGKSGGTMAGAKLNSASQSGGMLNSALQSKSASSGGAMAGATGGAGTGLLNSASQSGGTSKLNKGLQTTAGGLRKVPLVGGALATTLGLGAGAGKLGSKLITKPVSAIKDKLYQSKMNKDANGNKLLKGDPNRMSFGEAKVARRSEALAKKQSIQNGKMQAKNQNAEHKQSIINQAQKRGEFQAKQIKSQHNGASKNSMAQKADSILAKKAPELMNNKNNNSQRREAKKGIIQAMEQGYTGKALKQKIDEAIKNSNKPQNSSGGSNSALAKVGKDGGKK